MDDAEVRRLWLMQLRLENKRLDAAGRMTRARSKDEDPDVIPLCSVTRFGGIDHWSFSVAAERSVLDDIRHLDADDLFASTPAVETLLRRHHMCREVCSTYRFGSPRNSDAAGETIRTSHETYAVMVGGQEVSWATSARSNSQSAELWVFTDPEHRGRGFARRAASAWADEIIGSGRIAFYSHLVDNHASERLAVRLGVSHLFDVASLVADHTERDPKHEPAQE